MDLTGVIHLSLRLRNDITSEDRQHYKCEMDLLQVIIKRVCISWILRSQIVAVKIQRIFLERGHGARENSIINL